MEIWYYAFNGAQQGPVTQDALMQLIASGQLPIDSLVWREGMGNWVPARTVPELVPVAAPAGYQHPVAQPVLGYGVADSAYVPEYGVAPQYAGFWLRFGAAFIDGLIIYLPFRIVEFAMQFLLTQSQGRQGAQVGIAIASCGITLVQLVAGWLYFAKMESSEKMATIGKSVCGIKVTGMTGERISFGNASGRYFGKIVSMMTLYVGFMMAGWTQKKQALHDIMASTLVVRK